MSVTAPLSRCYARTSDGLAAWIGPVTLLLMRIWVALAFWQAGLVKIADPMGTRFLFEGTYHLPWLAPGIATVLATWIELIVPWFVGLGLLGRLSALFLFIYNIIAFSSFPALWPHGFWPGLFSTGAFADHKVWGLMLLAVIAWGPGKLSLDTLAERIYRRCHGITSLTRANS